MTISDTQRALLEAAAQHPQKLLTSFPATLKGGARSKVLTALRNAHLIALSTSESEVYMVTPLGMEAIGTKTETAHTKRQGSKQDLLIELLKRAQGATLAQMSEATGWQSHTVRGAMAGSLKKKLGLSIDSEKTRGADRIYRIATQTA